MATMDMQNHGSYISYEDRLADRIQLTLSRSLSRRLWKRILWRVGVALCAFLITGYFLLDCFRFLFPQIDQVPFIILLAVALLLCPVLIVSVRHILSLLVDLQMAHLDLLVVLGNAVAKRDQDTGEHNLRVAIMAVRLAEAARLDPRLINGLFMGAFLHDVGKIGVPDKILLKPGSLSQDERLEIEQHVLHGVDIVAGSMWLESAVRVVRCHHEKFDGSGYPDGKKGRDIPVEARIFSIVDVFDALVSRRPYKDALPFEQAVEIMEKERNKGFDPQFLDAFMRIAEILNREVIQSDTEQKKELAIRIIEKYSAQLSAGHLKLA